MKKFLLAAILLIPGVYTCYGQTGYQLDKDTSKYKNSPLVIIKNSGSSQNQQFNSIPLIDPNNIESIQVTKNGGNGTISMTLKSPVELVDMNQVFDKYKVEVKDRQLPVFIDSAIVAHPEKAYLELKMVKTVSIAEEKSTGMHYVSIRTINPILRPKNGEVMLRGTASDVKIN